MTVYYDFYKNPPQNGDENPEEDGYLHPRPVLNKTLKTDYLAELLSARSSFSSADMKGVLDNLAYQIFFGLSNNHSVYLEGLGTFSLSLESRPVKDIKEIRGSSVEVKGIHFRPDKQLKKRLKTIQCKRVDHPRENVSLTEEERLQNILDHIDKSRWVNITKVMKINSCNHKKAKADLQKLLDKKTIYSMNFGKTIAYYKG